MAIDISLLELMSDSVAWSTGGALSNYGPPVWSTATHPMAARVSKSGGYFRTKDGSSIATQGTVWCAPSDGSTAFNPAVADKVTLSDGSAPPVLAVEKLVDEAGNHHFKVTLGF